MVEFAAIVAALFVCFLFLYHLRRCCKDPLFIDWPVVGMLPRILWNMSDIHNFTARILNTQSTGHVKGPWFTGMNYLVTSNPMNVQHTMSKNFKNYVKGSEYREIFEPFGESLLTVDEEAWKFQRAIYHSLLNNRNFHIFLDKIVRNKVATCLLPLLHHVQSHGLEVDLQDVFNRFNFDIISTAILGSDPKCLAIDFPQVACEKAFNEAEKFIFYRHTMPKTIWKLQKWLGIGFEKKMAQARQVFDQFLYQNIASKREKIKKSRETMKEEAGDDGDEYDDLLTALMKEEEGNEHVDDKFVRDTAFTLFVAGRDTITSTLTWFFWLVATHPNVEAKIVEEMKQDKEVRNQVYLHAALCEALRLFPPVPFVQNKAVKGDVLPSGHKIESNTKIMYSLYAIGRSEQTWGEDCVKFKPERWISETGRLVHVPSYKFLSFHAGPRTCLGKDLSFIQMKIVVNAVLWNYRVQVVNDHVVSPTLSIVLMMKHGLKVRITKRDY